MAECAVARSRVSTRVSTARWQALVNVTHVSFVQSRAVVVPFSVALPGTARTVELPKPPLTANGTATADSPPTAFTHHQPFGTAE